MPSAHNGPRAASSILRVHQAVWAREMRHKAWELEHAVKAGYLDFTKVARRGAEQIGINAALRDVLLPQPCIQWLERLVACVSDAQALRRVVSSQLVECGVDWRAESIVGCARRRARPRATPLVEMAADRRQ